MNMDVKRKSLPLALLTMVILSAGTPQLSLAQDDEERETVYLPDEAEETDEPPERKQGWRGTLGVGGTINIASNQNVVGQNEGTAVLIGFRLLGNLDYLEERHEVLTTLSITESWARTPTIDEFIQTNDLFTLETIYNYYLIEWAGLFARGDIQTTLFNSEEVRAEPGTFVVADNDGSQRVFENQRRLNLSDPLSPTTLSQSIGAFVSPLRRETIRLTARAGFGARETFGDGVLVVQDDEETPEIELVELANVYQAGAEGFLGAEGKIEGGRITYDVGLTALLPLINNDDTDRDLIELTRVGATAEVVFGVLDWLSINYQFRAINDPQLLEAWQVQNSLLFTLNYTVLDVEEEVTP